MRERIHSRLIGLFVLGCFFLLLMVLLFMSGGSDFFARKEQFVLYFRDSMNGLNVGAPVKFRGVTVGVVTNIMVEVDPQNIHVDVPVIIQLNPSKVKILSKKRMSEDEFIKRLVSQGLRARLKMQSLIAGSLYVDLTFAAGGTENKVENRLDYYQIPTISSSSGGLSKILSTGQSVFESIQKLLETNKIENALDVFIHTMTHGNVLIENLNTHLIPATSSAKNAFDHFNTLFEKDEISSTFSSIHDTMLDSRELIQNINQQIDPTADKFDMAMKEFSNAMYSVNALADYLSRHPEALIQGKAPSTEGKKP